MEAQNPVMVSFFKLKIQFKTQILEKFSSRSSSCS